MSTPTEYMKLLGRLEAMRAEHSEDKRKALEARDKLWHRRVDGLADTLDYSAKRSLRVGSDEAYRAYRTSAEAALQVSTADTC